MKVLHITTTDYGGAYRAAKNINDSLIQLGVDSGLLVREKKSMEAVDAAIQTLGALFVSKTRNFVNLLLSDGDIVNDFLGYPILKDSRVQEADVIVLHWVNSFLSYRGVKELLLSGKPMIWVMHDMWLFTGGCHYDRECGKYETDCSLCPNAAHKRKTPERLLLKKKDMLANGKFVAVGCSNWITECAKKSRILEGKTCIQVSNPVDTDVYRPLDNRMELREAYGIGKEEKVILFGAMIPGDYRKGLDLLVDALKYLQDTNVVLCIVGKQNQVVSETHRMIMLGHVDSREKMCEAYNIADVMVVPSRQENLSNAVLEAMACGTPVAAFAIGGMSDMILHGQNGYMAQAFDEQDLANGIQLCCENREMWGTNARQETIDRFSYQVVGEKYKELLEQVRGKEDANM